MLSETKLYVLLKGKLNRELVACTRAHLNGKRVVIAKQLDYIIVKSAFVEQEETCAEYFVGKPIL